MKKSIITCSLLIACMCTTNAQAQSILSNLLQGVANSATQAVTTNTTSSTPQNTGKEVLGSVLNNVVSNSTSGVSGSTGNLLTNLITAVAGDVTTTSTTIVGNWSYVKPSVQFETENYLAQAGGASIAEKLETKLASAYKLASIKEGSLVFSFDNQGKVSYSVGSVKRQGTYEFDSATKTIVITTTEGVKIKSHVTVSGTNMYLTFDGTKFLSLMKTLGSRFNILSTVSTLAASYEGMKVGFCFEKK